MIVTEGQVVDHSAVSQPSVNNPVNIDKLLPTELNTHVHIAKTESQMGDLPTVINLQTVSDVQCLSEQSESENAESLTVAEEDKISEVLSKPCICCGSENAPYQCTQCKVAKFCSKECQRECWDKHKTICEAIHTLSTQIYNNKPTMFKSHITPTNHQRLIKLVGEKCIVNAKISNVPSKCLWDTGAQISVVSRRWLRKHFPSVKMRPIEELLNEPLLIRTANKTLLCYSGWVEFMFEVDSVQLPVPFLIVDTDIERPIIGYNVIKEMCKLKDEGTVEWLCRNLKVENN